MPERYQPGRDAGDYDRRNDFVSPEPRDNSRRTGRDARAESDIACVADFAAEDFKARWWPAPDRSRKGR